VRKQDRLGDSWLENSLIESSFAEKETGLLANKQFNGSLYSFYNKG